MSPSLELRPPQRRARLRLGRRSGASSRDRDGLSVPLRPGVVALVSGHHRGEPLPRLRCTSSSGHFCPRSPSGDEHDSAHLQCSLPFFIAPPLPYSNAPMHARFPEPPGVATANKHPGTSSEKLPRVRVVASRLCSPLPCFSPSLHAPYYSLSSGLNRPPFSLPRSHQIDGRRCPSSVVRVGLSRHRACSRPRRRLQHDQDASLGHPSPPRHHLAVLVELRQYLVSSRLTMVAFS
jgi:hypothetical protein